MNESGHTAPSTLADPWTATVAATDQRLPADRADRTRVHPLLSTRYSPRQFDTGHAVRDRDVLLLLEAARWAPSAGNSQPWLFLPVLRGTADHIAIGPLLAPSARAWALDASLLVLNFCRVGADGVPYSEFADYDLGQAVAHMTMQAQAMALHSRQFRAFDLEAVSRLVPVEQEWQLRSITAFGRALDRPPSDRSRRTIESLVPEGVL